MLSRVYARVAPSALRQVTVVDYAPPWRALKDSGVYEDHYRVLGGGGEEWVRLEGHRAVCASGSGISFYFSSMCATVDEKRQAQKSA